MKNMHFDACTININRVEMGKLGIYINYTYQRDNAHMTGVAVGIDPCGILCVQVTINTLTASFRAITSN